MTKCKYDDWEWYDWSMKMECLQGYNRCKGEKCPKFEPCEEKLKNNQQISKAHKVKLIKIKKI